MDKTIWELGQAVARQRPATLYGRGELLAVVAKTQKLHFEPTATPLNHANIVGWPTEKAAQKLIALELAAKAEFRAAPPSTE